MAAKESSPSAITLEQALAQLASADPQAFYRQAQQFEQAAGRLNDVQDLLSKYRRDLAEAWKSGHTQRQNRLDRLIRHLGGVVAVLQDSGYPQVLRQIGDAIADTKQRLAALRDGQADAADDTARSDVDKRAATLMDELSRSYRQLGGRLTELSARTDTAPRTAAASGSVTVETFDGAAPVLAVASTGQLPGAAAPMVPAKPAVIAKSAVSTAPVAAAPPSSMTRVAGTPMAGGVGGVVGTRAGGPVKRQGSVGAGVAHPHPALEGSAPPPARTVPFGRFSHLAGCPVPGRGPFPGDMSGRQYGPAGGACLFAQPEFGRPAVLGKAVSGVQLNGAERAKNGNDKNTAAGARSNRYDLPDVTAPSRLESQPALTRAVVIPLTVNTTGAGPAVRGVPVGQQAAAAVAGLPAGSPSANGPQAGSLGELGGTPGGMTSAGTDSGGRMSVALSNSPQPSVSPPAQVPAQAASAQAPVQPAGSPVSGPPALAAPVQTPAPAAIPTQMRPWVALGGEHLQVAGGVTGGPGLPLGAVTAQSTLAQSVLGSSSAMTPTSSLLPAIPHGVLGSVPRGDAVWLRADANSWASAPVAVARLGKDHSGGPVGTGWSTERHDDGKGGR